MRLEMTTMNTSRLLQKNTFTVSPKYIIEIMRNQTEGLPKALSELVMNSVDAGASEIRINFYTDPDTEESTFTVTDDGKGFTKTDIMEYFRQFGEPHDPADGCFYGKFRMGRSQILCLSVTEWHTHKYIMKVDIEKAIEEKNYGDIGFELHHSDEYVKGCRIEGKIYPKHKHKVSYNLKDRLQDLVRHVPIKAYFNDELISESIKDLKKKYRPKERFEDEFAYYFIDAEAEDLRLYNRGVWVEYHELGNGLVKGIIITKQQLRLDHSRRFAISEECPVWHGIKAHIDTVATEACLQLSDAVFDESFQLFCQAIKQLHKTGIKWCKALDHFVRKPMLVDHSGATRSLLDLFPVQHVSTFYDYEPVVERAARIAHCMFICMSGEYRFNELLGVSFNHSFPTFVEFANQACRLWMEHNPDHADNAAYVDLYDRNIWLGHSRFDATYKELDAFQQHEKRGTLEKLEQLNVLLHEALRDGQPIRAIKLGYSDEAEAWTNGTDQIHYNFEHAELAIESGNLMHIFLVLLHEYCHTNDNHRNHNQEFYEKYHNLSMKINWHNLLTHAVEVPFSLTA